MSTEAKVIFTGENRGLLELYEQERRKVQQKDEALRRASRVAKQAYDEEKQLARDAAKAIERSLTPLERLKQEREKLRKQLALGIVTEKEFHRLQNQLNNEFKEGKQNTAAYREEQRKLNAEKQKARDITRSVETAEERYERQLKELRAQLKAGRIDQETFNRAVRKSATDAGIARSRFGEFGKSMIGLATTFIGVHQGLALIRKEYEAVLQRNEDARLATMSFAEVMQSTRNAFVADDTISDEELEGRLQEAAIESRTPVKIFAAAMQDVFSAKGDATNEEAVQAAIAAFRLNPGDLESGRTLAARALDLRQSTGSKDFVANVGFVQNLQQAARATDLEAVGQHIIPAIGALMTRGDTAEQAGEIAATLNTLMQDAEGRRTRTAAISLSTQLREFVPENPNTAAAYSQAGSTTERLKILQANPQLGQEFLGKASFEQAAVAYVEALVSGDPLALAVQRDKEAKINPLNAEQALLLEENIRRKEASSAAQLLAAEQASQTNIESFQIGEEERAQIGQARKIFGDTLAQTSGGGVLGRGEIGKVVTKLGFDLFTTLGADPEQEAIRRLKGEASEASTGSERTFIQKQIAILEKIEANTQKTGPAPRVKVINDRLPAANLGF